VRPEIQYPTHGQCPQTSLLMLRYRHCFRLLPYCLPWVSGCRRQGPGSGAAAPQRWRSINALMKQLPAVPKPAPRVISTSRQRPAIRGRLPLDASTRQLLAARLQKPPQGGPRMEAGDTPQQLPDTVSAGLPSPPRSAGCGPAAAVAVAAPGCGSQQAAGAAVSVLAAAAGCRRAASHRHGARPPTQ
jgi:hypothetical protein